MLWTLWLPLVQGYELFIDDLFPQPKFEVRLGSVLKEPFVPMLVNGTEYKCHVPQLENWLQREQLTPPSQQEKDAATAIIGGLEDCTYLVENYWGYRLCHNKEIWQMHPEKKVDKFIFKESNPSFFLGNYSGSASVEPRNGKWHLKVPYNLGTPCDLTGQDRVADVFYVCDEEATGESIIDVKETHICVYEFVVATNKLCPIFKTAEEPVNYIECFVEGYEDEEPVAITEYATEEVTHYVTQVAGETGTVDEQETSAGYGSESDPEYDISPEEYLLERIAYLNSLERAHTDDSDDMKTQEAEPENVDKQDPKEQVPNQQQPLAVQDEPHNDL